MYITPCKKDILNYSEKNKIFLKEKIKNNELIKLWGKYEKIYDIYIMKSKKIKIFDFFKRNKDSNLLEYIKNDFLENNILKLNQINNKRFLQLSDNSISINICYSKKNEIEILYKKLLLFLEKSYIQPGDIVVTTFSIDTYIPYIEMIFNTGIKKEQIPFFISKKFSKKTEIIFSSFNKILDLPNSRFQNEEILELLDVPEIGKHFNISEEEIDILYNWIEEANIRWAINSKHKNDLSFPGDNQNTWFYGIEKLLLSYAMNNIENTWNNILSCSVINGSRAELVGKLIFFIKKLNKWKKKLSKSQSLIHWHSLSENLFNDFFYNSLEIEKSTQIIKKIWKDMIDDGLSSNYLKKISINILKKNFIYKYNSITTQIFSPGVVNFCHPSSICYIPFKITCIIGADHNNDPKNDNLDTFNLLKKYPLSGDIDIHEKYSYLFFQSISCTQKFFYISYVGYSIKDESKVYPSILVEQLLNYIILNFRFTEKNNLTVENNTKKIIKHLCKQYKKEIFYENKNINNFLITNDNNIFKKIDNDSLIKYNFNKINLKNLINFWKNPIQYFFNFNLKIKFNLKKEESNTTEPFLINTLDSFTIKNTILNKIIYNQDINQLLEHYTLSGKLPHSSFRKIFLNKNIEEMTSIAKLVMQHRILTKEKKINFKINKYQINGILSEIQSTGLLRWKPNVINYNDRISLWLEHLIYSISGGFGISQIIGYKKQIWSFSPINSDIAHTYLLQYINGYIQGMKKPLLLIKSGASWLDQVYDIKNNFIKNDEITKQKGYKKLLETWTGNNYIQGEKDDFYIKKIINTLNTKNIEKICKIAKIWLVPILKNKKK